MAKKKEKIPYLVGIYDDDEKILHAVETIRGRGIKITDVFTPFPIHGLEHALGYKDSRLPDAAFIFGALGTITALTLQIGTYTIDWQVNVGGKSSLPLPSFIPVTFELTVLFASLGMVATYLIANKIAPGVQPEVVDPRQTDDRFVIIVKAGD
ncbi:MAG: DUF3341 domain-containing protein, partial [Bacteroidia bacterium]|nr:DUF3341 domain-containing protein [Bacteroidia bacterium]